MLRYVICIPQQYFRLKPGVKILAKYLFKRLLVTVLSQLLIVTVVFLVIHAIPGGPFAREKKLPPEIIKNLNERYHLNDSLWKQYTDYMGNLLKGDLGPSFRYEDQSVNDLIKRGFPVSATLGAIVVLFSLIVGSLTGIVAALNHNKWPDFLAMLLAMVNFSVPSFILAPLLLYVFALKLNWFPPAMWGEPEQIILPSLALSAGPTAFIASLVRSSMLETMVQDYIKTARAKGLSEKSVIFRHAFKNAVIPVVTYLGPLIAGVFTGSFVIERVFAIPGLGEHFVTSISNRDYTVIMGVTIFYSTFLMVMNLLVDILYVVIDPRIKLTDNRQV